MRPGENAGLSVARYLRPEEAVVPFRSRPELEELLRWCVSGGHAAVRLVTGDGGAGKTRIALRLSEELEANGWQPLWVPRGSERDAVEAAHTMGQPCVLVVDYAETRTDLVGLLDDVAADQNGPDLRVVLLARSAGEWWQQLLASVEEQTAGLLGTEAMITLGPVRAVGGPQEIFGDAAAAFAQKMGTGRPDAKLVLSDPDPVVLVVHAAALLAVVDHATGASPRDQAVSGREVLETLLGHEARYWARSAAGRSLDLDVSLLRLAVAVGCLIGADSETTASALLSRIPDLDSAERRGRVARWLHDLYPTPNEDDGREYEWLGPLRPDRLAEQLITGELTRRPELIAPLFTGLGEAQGARALTVLARAALTQGRAVSLLRTALAADLDHLAVAALSVAIETNPVLGELLGQVIRGQPVSRETLVNVAEVSPYPSLALAAPTAVVLQRLADNSADDSERATWLVELSNRLGDLGRREEALAAIDEAVAIRQELAETRPEAFLPDLARSLHNQAGRLAVLGRREEALAASEEAAGIYRDLAEASPEVFLPYLAVSLNNQSVHLGDLGRREEALAAVEQAVAIYRQLAEARPETFRPDLAMSLNNQSVHLGDLGRREEALAAAEEASGIFRELAKARPDAFLLDLASSLYNRSLSLAGLGRREEALAAVEQAVAIYRQLAEARPETFLPDVAMSLNIQSNQLAALGRREEALAAIDEAVAIRRELAEARPEAFLPDLAASLNNQAGRLAALGRPEEALAAIEEASGIFRELAKARPAVFLPDLAASLNNRSLSLAGLGRREEALAAVEQAVAIYRQLAEARPETFLPDVAMSLNNQSGRLAALDRPEEALAAAKEAWGIYRELAKARPAVFLRDVARSLNNQSVALALLSRREEALAAIEEAVAIRRELAEARPEAFLPDLARSLYNQSGHLGELGRREEGLATIEEAAGIFRVLAEARPVVFLPDLARSLYRQSDILSLLNRDAEASAIREAAVVAIRALARE